MIAFSVGMVAITVYPNLHYVKDILHATPDQNSTFKSLGSIAWSIKPIIGYLEDQVNPFYFRIKSWLALGCMMSIGMCSYIFVSSPSIGLFTVMFGIVNLAAVM